MSADLPASDRRYLSRKFALAAAAFLAGLVLFVLHRLTSIEWIGFTQWIVGLYLAGNVADQAATAFARKGE